MINYHYETDFNLEREEKFTEWINTVIDSEEKLPGEINYIFCDDEYLFDINKQYLNHDTYTDIISFDYTEGNVISGDIFISVDRIKENSIEFNTTFLDELIRVMAHGVLHYCGYKDKSIDDEGVMREKENEKISMFHVER